MTLPRRPRLAAVLSLLTALAPSAATAQFSSENEAPLPTVELAREGPFEVVCVDSRNQEITSFGPLFRVLRDNGREVRWQYEMEDGLTFIGRFDDLLTCRYEDRRRRKR
ncbi:hypothetical protein [Skermanella pratensis]|uniref:hypothetical protein n=1 Tax=Skermanella pratensis TaxID=2233999 RepID=UPI0013014E4B|nr:hypothetical protein [Skermanella pratensis]